MEETIGSYGFGWVVVMVVVVEMDLRKHACASWFSRASSGVMFRLSTRLIQTPRGSMEWNG